VTSRYRSSISARVSNPLPPEPIVGRLAYRPCLIGLIYPSSHASPAQVCSSGWCRDAAQLLQRKPPPSATLAGPQVATPLRSLRFAVGTVLDVPAPRVADSLRSASPLESTSRLHWTTTLTLIPNATV
jgi:hypothetical protein